MSVTLRFMRFGKKNRPCYRLCAMDVHAPRDGAYIESLGFYDPFIADDQKRIRLNKERIEYWLKVGALPSESVTSFFRKTNISGFVRAKKPRKRRNRKTDTALPIGAAGTGVGPGAVAGSGRKPKPPKKPRPPKE